MSTVLMPVADPLGTYAENREPVDVRDAASVVCEFPGGQRVSVDERRAHVRLTPEELQSPLRARLKYGPPITLIDVSAGGALVEASSRLFPGAQLMLEFVAPDDELTTIVPSHVVRAQVTSLWGGLRYRGACVFEQLLNLPDLAARPPGICDPTRGSRDASSALRAIVERYLVHDGTNLVGNCPAPIASPASLADAIEKLQAAIAKRSTSADRTFSHLLSDIVLMVRRCESPQIVFAYVEEQLRRHVPLLSVRIGIGTRLRSTGAAALSIDLAAGVHGRQVLSVQFRAECSLRDSQLRLLEAGAYLMSLLYAGGGPALAAAVARPAETRSANLAEIQIAPEPAAPAAFEASVPVDEPATAAASEARLPVNEQPRPGWWKIVVRFVDGTLLRGFCNDFHAERAHLHLSPTCDAREADRLLVPMAHLKAVFFVRDFCGNPDHVESQIFDHAPRTRKVMVTFRDGEVVVGSTTSFKPGAQGFIMTPADSKGNNIRVYVVNAALRHTRFL